MMYEMYEDAHLEAAYEDRFGMEFDPFDPFDQFDSYDIHDGEGCEGCEVCQP